MRLTATRYDNMGQLYNKTRILDPKTMMLDPERYREYSPLYMSSTFALLYGVSFAAISAVIVHIALFHGPETWRRMRNAKREPLDIHARLYLRYRRVPFWWFLGMFTATVVLGILCVALTPLHEQLPVWAFLFAVSIALFFIVPVGIINAMTVRPSMMQIIYMLIRNLERSTWSQHFHRDDHLLHAAWKTNGNDDLQNLWIHYHGAGIDLRTGSEASLVGFCPPRFNVC